MSTNKKNYPNDYYAWYNDDGRFAVVEKVTSSGDGSVHHDAYDSIQTSSDMLTGTMTEMVTDGSTVTVTCSAAHGLTASTDKVTITGTRHYNGNYTVASTPSTTTFTFASSALGADADTVSDLDVLSETATVTTGAAHGYSVGDIVYINESTDAYDEKVTIATVADSTHFTYTTSKSDTTNKTGTVGDTGSFYSQVANGIRVSYHSKYTDVSAQTDDLYTNAGLDSGMHQHILCYVKARLFEDLGDLEKSAYYRKMFEIGIKQYPMRKSGVRGLTVPRL